MSAPLARSGRCDEPQAPFNMSSKSQFLSDILEQPSALRRLLTEGREPVQRAAAQKARDEGGAVVEGRDIGTVVLPDAELKVYLSAAPEERARRRAYQTGKEGELDRIRAAIARRDRQDSEREISPLKPAADAVVLDTTSLSLEEVVSTVLDLAADLREQA